MTNSSLNHKIRDIWYSATRFQDICPTNKSIIWNSEYVSQLPTANRFLLTGKASYCVLIANCILLTSFLLLSMCEKKLSKYRYWGLIILLHLHHYLIQKMIFLLETSSIIVTIKYQPLLLNFQKISFMIQWMKERSPIPPPIFSEINSGYTNVYNISYDCFFFIHACTEMKT